MTKGSDNRASLIPRLSAPTARVLHWGSLAWALAAIAGLIAATEFGWLDYRPGGDAYEILQQQIFGVVFAVAALIAWRWKAFGGAIAGLAAGGLIVFAVRQLEPFHAAIVVTAFVVPGLLWMVYALSGRSYRYASSVVAVVAAAAVFGGLAANEVYQGLFGPSHPASDARALAVDGLEWFWSGGVTGRSAVVNAKLADDATGVRLVVSPAEDLHDARFGRRVRPGPERRVRLPVSGLVPDTQYHYAVEVDGEVGQNAGTFTTFPEGPDSFTFAVGACARVGSNGAVFDAIRDAEPLFYIAAGDLHYANIGEDDPGAFREIYDYTLSQPGQSALYRSTPLAYVWDDHDFTGDGSDGTSPARPAAVGAYRENVPHYSLADSDSTIHQAFTVGRMRVVVTDARSGRSPSSQADDSDKTMLGVEQKSWFKRELVRAAAAHEVILWVNSVPWIAEPSVGGDDWGGYTTERRELADFIASNEIDGLVMVSGDAHMVAIDDGTNTDYSTAGEAAFPVLHAAALDRPGSTKGGPYSEGSLPGGGQFGLVRVTDSGDDEIDVELSGFNWEGKELMSHAFSVPMRPS